MMRMLRADAERHEAGDGVPRDITFAAALYCKAAKLGDAESQFHLGWMYAYGRGVERNDAWASYFLRAAAEQGIEQAPNLLRLVGSPEPQQPDCMRDPPPPASQPAAEPQEMSFDAIPPKLEAAAPKKLVELVSKLAPEFKVQPRLALAIIKAESNFDPAAVSPKNAQGLMQLIPETAARFSVKNPFDVRQNLRGGLAYLRWLLAYFQGDLRLVAAAYNAGERTVERYAGVPPYGETRAYVRRVVEAAGTVRHPFDPTVTQPSPSLSSIRTAQ